MIEVGLSKSSQKALASGAFCVFILSPWGLPPDACLHLLGLRVGTADIHSPKQAAQGPLGKERPVVSIVG